MLVGTTGMLLAAKMVIDSVGMLEVELEVKWDA